MAPPVATCEPTSFVAGDTVQWRKTVRDYPASDGWTLKYAFRGAGKVDVTAATNENGSDYDVEISASASSELKAGTYQWSAWVELDGEIHTVAAGSVTVDPNLLAADEGDLTSNSETELAAVNAAILAITTGTAKDYTIGQRSVTKLDLPDLYRRQAMLESKIRAERGLGFKQRKVAFVGSC